jgi:hypothetical protein
VAALLGAASFALFTSQATGQTDTFAAGTVVLANTTPTAVNTKLGSCDIKNMEPGDSSSSPPQAPLGGNGADPVCTYDLTYSGSLNAWVGLQISVSSSSAVYSQAPGSATTFGGSALLNGSPNGLQYEVWMNNGTGTQIPSSSLPTLSCNPKGTTSGAKQTCTGSTTSYILFKGTTATSTNNHPKGSWSQGENGKVVVEYALPLQAGNSYQGGTAQITISATAVQASNNPLNSNKQPEYGWTQTPSA